MADASRLELAPKDLRWTCDPDSLGFKTTDDFTCKPHIIGQDRALDAIRLGLEMKNPGYNVYISGLVGTGKQTAIRRILRSMDLKREDLQDLCYVHNFKLPDSPTHITLPCGSGQAFKERMQEALKAFRGFIPEAFRSDKFKHQQAKILDDVKKRKNDLTTRFEKEVLDHGFSLVEVEYGGFSRPEIAPMVSGEVVSMDRLPALLLEGKLGRGDFDKMQRTYPELMGRLDEVITFSRELQNELNLRMRKLERDYVLPVVKYTFSEIRKEFKDDKVNAFLEGLQVFVMKHVVLFTDGEQEGGDGDPRKRAFLPFEVNVLVDNSGATEAPVVIETHPSFANLFGTIERRVDKEGDQITDFMSISAGSLLRANGGYLVLNLNDILEEPYAWPTLKRALKTKSHVIRGFDSILMVPVAPIKPEPVELDIKIVLIGDSYSYQVLYEYDEDFGKIFKVKAEFDSVMPRLKKNLKRYCDFIKNMCVAEDLLPFHKSGAAAVIEEGVRIAGRQRKLSTRFSDISDVLREASYWARRAKKKSVRGEHVQKAVEEKARRASLYEEKIQEMFNDGTILIDTAGAQVGQVNGLAVFDLGDHRFGKPSRITVETGVGRTGVVNIEREADLSGRTHNKGVLILEGYMRRMYAQDKPVTMAASICFEQSYSGVDGDSASSTEVYALLSSLSGVPLRQNVAVTGSVNQKGEVQPIGGANEKIEGFFDVCKYKGLNGRQGVMIPALNKGDLMLRRDVVDAVKAGKFHIYAVKSINDGIEVLTEAKAGRRLKSGGFQKDSIHAKVDERLRRYLKELTTSENGDDQDDGGHKDHKAK